MFTWAIYRGLLYINLGIQVKKKIFAGSSQSALHVFLCNEIFQGQKASDKKPPLQESIL